MSELIKEMRLKLSNIEVLDLKDYYINLCEENNFEGKIEEFSNENFVEFLGDIQEEYFDKKNFENGLYCYCTAIIDYKLGLI